MITWVIISLGIFSTCVLCDSDDDVDETDLLSSLNIGADNNFIAQRNSANQPRRLSGADCCFNND